MIARHFGEQWKEGDCNRMCDVCASVSSSDKGKRGIVDYTRSCLGFVRILEESKKKDQRLTAIKLMELSRKEDKLNTLERDRLLVHCVLEGILKEEFHFTPYTTISYIALGKKSAAVKSGHLKVTLPALDVATNSDVTPSFEKSSDQSSSPSSSNTRKRKIPDVSKSKSGQREPQSSPEKLAKRTPTKLLYNSEFDSDDDFLGCSSSSKGKQKKISNTSDATPVIIVDSSSSD